MRQILLAISFILVLGSELHAQRLSGPSDQVFNPFIVNGAVSGISGSKIFLHRREQWKEFNGPVLNAGSAEFILPEMPMSLGAVFSNQTAGVQTATRLKLNYTYHLSLSDENSLLFGISGGLLNSKISSNSLIPERADDPLLATLPEQTNSPDIDAGIVFKGEMYHAGLTVNQLQGNAMSKDSPGIKPSRYFTLTGGGRFPLTEDSSVRLMPNALVRLTPGEPLQYSANVTASWQDLLFAGLSYKGSFAFSVNAGLQFKNAVVSYAYELPVNNIKSYLPVVHEFSLGYFFRKNKQSKPPKDSSVKEPSKDPRSSRKEQLKEELQKLVDQYNDREEQLMLREREIYNAIDSLYSKANQQQTRTNEEELEKIARTQKEVDRIKQELKAFSKEKNVELFLMRRKIDELRKEVNKLK